LDLIQLEIYFVCINPIETLRAQCKSLQASRPFSADMKTGSRISLSAGTLVLMLYVGQNLNSCKWEIN
jgi:hypothetical protein